MIRVAITGLGIISPFGRGKEAACAALRNGRSGVKGITSIDASTPEGAAVLFLESFDSALRRGVEIRGEIAGFGATSDAGHLTDPSAEGAARAMSMALRDAGIESVDYINAHGTATRTAPPHVQMTSPKRPRSGQFLAVVCRRPARRSRCTATRWAPAAPSRSPARSWRATTASSPRPST